MFHNYITDGKKGNSMSEVIDERRPEGEELEDERAETLGEADTDPDQTVVERAEEDHRDEGGADEDSEDETAPEDGASGESTADNTTGGDAKAETGETAEEPAEATVARRGLGQVLGLDRLTARIADGRSRAAERRDLAAHHDALVKAHAAEEASVAKEASARLSDHRATPEEHAAMMQTVRTERAEKRESDRLAAIALAEAQAAERQRQDALAEAGRIAAEASRLYQEASLHAKQVQLSGAAYYDARRAWAAAAAAMETEARTGHAAQAKYEELKTRADELTRQADALKAANTPAAAAAPEAVLATA